MLVKLTMQLHFVDVKLNSVVLHMHSQKQAHIVKKNGSLSSCSSAVDFSASGKP